MSLSLTGVLAAAPLAWRAEAKGGSSTEGAAASEALTAQRPPGPDPSPAITSAFN